MTPQKIKFSPSNSFVLISDSGGGSVPDPEDIARDANITATDSCVVVVCLPEVDGETEITLGPADGVDPGSPPAFDRTIATPSGNVKVFSVDWKPLLEAVVSTARTRIRVWKNRQRFPDKVTIGVE